LSVSRQCLNSGQRKKNLLRGPTKSFSSQRVRENMLKLL
jgi:hypothetical protein